MGKTASIATVWVQFLKEKLRSAEDDIEQLSHEKSAAVLVLFMLSSESGTGHLLLTKRTSTVDSHKGQMSFPGGYREKSDKNWLETALREAREEVGIRTEQVTVLGSLKPVLTKGEVTILPYVGVIQTQTNFILNQDEVEKTVLLPTEILMAQGLKPIEVREEQVLIQSIGIEWEGELIWGATAKMLEQIYEIFSQLSKPTS